jgi:dolichol kinase
MLWSYKLEVARKGIHILSTSFILIYLIFAYLFSHTIGLFALAFLLIVLIELEYVRIEIGKKIPLISRLWAVKRAKEREKLGGEVFFLIGAIICLAIFNLPIAITAILMTTFGDLAAALIGKRFGKHWLPYLKNRAWEGIIAELIVNIIIGFLIIGTFLSKDITGWIIIITMALTATIVETIIDKLDDNLLIPVFTGFNGQIALLIVSLFL